MKKEAVLRIAYRPPYDWTQVRDYLAARAVPGVECVDEHGYARTIRTAEGHAVICVRPDEADDALEFRVRGGEPGTPFQLSSVARRVFDVAADPARIASAFASDPLLGPLVKRHPGLRIPGIWDPFECVVRAVVGQQVTVAGGRTLAARLVACAGRAFPTTTPGLTHLFPTAAELAGSDLSGLGLTTGRIAALQALAHAVAKGKINFEADADTICATLAALPGIGAWTAQYVALRGLGEPDAFPASDLVLRRMANGGAGETLSEHALRTRAEKWRPWRGYAAMHLWRAAVDAARHRPERPLR